MGDLWFAYDAKNSEFALQKDLLDPKMYFERVWWLSMSLESSGVRQGCDETD